MSKTTLSRRIFSHTPMQSMTGVFAAVLGLAILLVAVVAALSASEVTAAPSSQLNYQSRFKMNNGALPADGYYNVTFRLYTADSGGSAVWTEARIDANRVRVVNGFISVQLGSVTPFSTASPAIDWGQEMWLTTEIGGADATPTWDGEMQPRLKLTAVPYAFKAGEAKSLRTTDGSFTGSLGWQEGSLTGNREITLPDESGIVCLQTSDACGFAPASGGAGYIQNSTDQQPAPANFNIDGEGKASTLNATTSLQLNGTDINTAGTLTNVAYLNQVTTFKATTNSTTAFRVQNAAGTATVLGVDTTNLSVSMGQASSTTTFEALATQPTPAPTGNARGVTYSSDGQYMVVAHWTSPYVTIYKRSGDTFTKLPNPSTLPTGNAYSASFSPDAQYLAVAHFAAPYVTIYKRSGDTFTKLANPAVAPTGDAYSTSFSPDGQYLSVGHNNSPYVTIYKRSGDTFTKLANPGTLPTGIGWSTTFSPDNQYMSVAHPTTPFTTIYKRSGDTFTSVSLTGGLPAGDAYGVSFSPDNVYMAIGHANSPYVTIYKRSGDTFTKLSNVSNTPGSIGTRTKFSPDGSLLVVMHNASPHMSIYQRSGDTFTKLTTPATVAGSDYGYDAAFTPDGQYLTAVFSNASPYMMTYKVGNGTSANLSVQGDGYVAGQVLATSLVTSTISGNGATFASLAASSATVQNATISSGLSVTTQIKLADSATNPGLLQLGMMASVSDPASAPDGSMYYNSTMNVFRCRIAGAWQTCGGIDGGSISEDSLNNGGNAFGEETILGTTDAYGLSVIINNNEVANISSAGDVVLTPGQTFAVTDASDNTVLGVNTTTSAITMNADAQIHGALSMTSGDLAVVGNAAVGGDLAVAGATTLTGNLSVQSSMGNNVLDVNTATSIVTIGDPNALNWDGVISSHALDIDQPTQTPRAVEWSPNGQFLAVTHVVSGGPYLTIYTKTGETLEVLSGQPDTQPTGSTWGVSWSPDSTYLVATHSGAPRMTIYKRSGSTFTKLISQPSVAPTTAGNGYTSAWSPNGRYLVVGTTDSTTNIAVYERTGDTFTKLASPTTPALSLYALNFSPDGEYLAAGFGGSGSGGVRLYQHSSGVLTDVSSRLTSAPSGDNVYGATWSGDGTYLVFAHYGGDFVSIYKRTGDTFTKLDGAGEGVDVPPTTNAVSAAFSNSGQYLIVGNTWVPYITMYKRTGDTFTKVDMTTSISAQALSVSFSGDNNYLAVAQGGGDLTVWRSGGGDDALPGGVMVGGTMTADTLFLGNPASGSLAGAKLVATTVEVQTTLRLGNATSGISWNDITTGSGGGKLRLYGNARNVRSVTLTPEYTGAVLTGTGTGVMASGTNAGMQFYQWSATATSTQSYDIVVSVALPSDWSAWSAGDAICVWSDTDSPTNATANLFVMDSNTGATDVNGPTITPGTASTPTQQCYSLTSANYTANGTMTLRLQVNAKNSASVYVGDITLRYLSAF